MAYRVALTLKSANAKTGPIPVSTTAANTCPAACPLQGKGGCYAEGYPLKGRWDEVSRGERGTDWASFCDAVADLPANALWRHNQAGDLPSADQTHIDAEALSALVAANIGKRGFTYTHYDPSLVWNAAAIRAANADGFTVSLSANNPEHADALADLGIAPVVTLLASDQTTNCTTPAGRKIVVCPATQRDDVTCATCGLCQRQARPIIGFPAHGNSKKAASATARRFTLTRS